MRSARASKAPSSSSSASGAPTSRSSRREPAPWATTSATVHTSVHWSERCNDLIRRVCDLYPENFAPVCQLPQSPGAPIEPAVSELRRCVEQLGFVGCNLNPDPSGGYWTGPPLFDRSWYPLYEAMVELDVPAMVHVSAACNPQFHTTGSHYLGADTTAFMQLLTSDLLVDFPDPAVDHPARRRRRPVPLGSVPGHRAGPRQAAARRTAAEQRVLRHLRLPPGRDRLPAWRSSRRRTSCSPPRWSGR